MHTRWKLAVVTLPLVATVLAGCGKEEPAPPAPPASPESTVAASSVVTTSSATSAKASSATASSTKTATSATSVSKEVSSVRKVAEVYGSLAPEEFFLMFEDCAPNGIPESSACTGPEVGQFQFFKGDAKAASTTQLLTELRSSRVVEDSGDRVVGWSTLGTTAVITVVDNNKGLTMQQMVSSDKQDPLERIYELGLAKPKETETPTPSAEPEAV